VPSAPNASGQEAERGTEFRGGIPYFLSIPRGMAHAFADTRKHALSQEEE